MYCVGRCGSVAGGAGRAEQEAVAHMRSAVFDMSERRACRTIGCARMRCGIGGRRPADAELRQRLRALAP